ncbi:hypothetical protein ACQFX9_23865 [Aliinostoc sp. HNIBRCY26]|uniref:hypothetical protein n=1 Tax=Aliinostoc sp. HNIBRCY26 TaxID=3418997 RepID=UPI003CFD2020
MSSGRYQSRLFNTVHQQSRRLASQWEQTFRHLQVATKWGVEVLLYPVYLFLQSTDTAIKTLYSKEPPSPPKLSPNHSDLAPETSPPVDTPIQHVLEAVQNLPTEETKVNQLLQPLKLLWSKFFHHPTNNSPLPQTLTIPHKTVQNITPSSQNDVVIHQLSLVGGIATDLINRRLVLVSVENEILDILTPQQQAKLSKKIINELTNYFPNWQLHTNQNESHLLPQIERVLDKLTGKQTVEIHLLNGIINQYSLQASKIITSLDTALARLEAKTIVPSQEIAKFTHTQINIFLYGKEQLAARGEIAVNADDLEAPKLNIAELIEAAINYFFGVGKSKNLNVPGARGKLISAQTSEQWLEWSDLYGETPQIRGENTPNTLMINPGIAPSSSTGLSWQNKLPIPPTKSESSLVPRQKQPRHLTRIQKKSGKITTRKQIETSISPTSSDIYPHQDPSEADWIETKPTSVSYEKHPLEQVLEFLDRAMLWLEEKIVRVFQSLQSFWRGK